MKSDLIKQINIGKDTESKLIKVGIDSFSKLKAIGSEQAFLRLQTLDPGACIWIGRSNTRDKMEQTIARQKTSFTTIS